LHGFEVHGIAFQIMMTNGKEITWAYLPAHLLEGGNR